MLLRFTKMHGLGNDFVVIDGVSQAVTMTPELARRLGDRHFGIGCDQILIAEPPSHHDTDFRYRIFNQDGNEVEQCGNGARCFAKFVRDRHLTGKKTLQVETGTGIITLRIKANNLIEVSMGVPILTPADIPFVADAMAINYPLSVNGRELSVSVVSMGNPHAVLTVADVQTAPVETLGPAIESHYRFPQRVNVGFMQILSRQEINLRVYERGVGETLACGTGACAAVVAGHLQELLDSTVTVNLPGGSLQIEWPGEGQPVIMSGPATTVFHGRIKL
ncbi:diaminopimelate epimerase [Porticoccus sp.]|uniref:diaminopimelate epimerase n=1 Tax=Porticoccus sp. TaxID=2024853 RepID=UPI003F697950